MTSSDFSCAGILSVWNAQSVQAVFFVATTEGLKADDIFQKIWETEPETSTRNKVPRPDNPFLSVAAGQVADFASEIQVQPGRVDIHVVAVAEHEEPGFATINAENAIRDLAQRVGAVNAISVPIVRLALVSNLLNPTDNLDSANNIIFNLLGFDPQITGTDITFQFNSRKPFGFESSLAMNRLLRYQALSFQQFAISIGNGNFSQNPVPVGPPPTFGVSLVVDLNTAPDGRFIESKNIAPIFEEFASEALRIGETGQLKALKDK